MKIIKLLTIALTFFINNSLNNNAVFAEGKTKMDLENTLYLEIPAGTITIEMYEEVAPKHVKRIKELVREGFYDGLTFHRVIENFMAQGGDPAGNGTGGSGKNLEAEFSDIKHERGVLSMARSANPNSGDSQFFIMFGNSPHLDGQYTVWGKIIENENLIDTIKRGSPANNGAVEKDPTKIVSMKIAADVKK